MGAKTSTSSEPVADQVYVQLRGEITELVLRPGERLSENRLAARLGVSRTPVRQALSRLRDEYLVHPLFGGGLMVSGLTERDADGLLDLLELIDQYIFACAASRVHDGHPEDQLGALAERMEEAAAASDLPVWSATDLEFHDHVNDLAGNQWATNVAIETRARLHRFWVVSSARQRRLMSCSLEHVELARAVTRGDSVASAQLVHQHIGHMRESLHEMLTAAAPLLGSVR